MRSFHFHDAQKGAAITVKIMPRAKKTELAGLMDDGTIKIRIAAPAVEGAANQALIEFLAELFKIKKDQVEIVVGHTSERKLVSLLGVAPNDVETTIHNLVPEVTEAEDDEAADPKKDKVKKETKPANKNKKKK